MRFKLAVILSVIVAVSLFWLVGCGAPDTSDVQSWAEKTLNNLESYHVRGTLLVHDKVRDTTRSYQLEEWYKSPNKMRVELASLDSDNNIDDTQVFLLKDNKVVIYHLGILEQYTLPEGHLSNKLSFLFFDRLAGLTLDDMTLEELSDSYKVSITKDDESMKWEEIYLNKDRDLTPLKLMLYRDDEQTRPIMEVEYDKVSFNSDISEEKFLEGMLSEDLQEREGEICRITEIEEEELTFPIKMPCEDKYSIKHTSICPDSQEASIKFSTRGEDKLLTLSQSVHDKEVTKEVDGSGLTITGDTSLIREENYKILTWDTNNITYNLLTSRELTEQDLLEIKDNLILIE